MTGFTKLFSTLVHSTVWREEMHVKIVWITMLALADRNGIVPVSLPGLADASRVTLAQCEEALARLSGPDKHSRTKEHDGRRIEEVDGGWRLLNYIKYRELRNKDERRIKTRDAVQRHRARKKAELLTVSNVSTGKHNAEAEAEAEADTTTTRRHRARVREILGDTEDLTSILRTARNPEALCAEIMAHLTGMRKAVPTPDQMHQTLRDLAITGERVTGRMLWRFLEKVMEPDGKPAKPEYTGYQEYNPK